MTASQQVLQLAHDMANSLQELIAIIDNIALMEIDIPDIKRLETSLHDSSNLLRLYILIYRGAPIESCLEQIQIYSNRTIEFDHTIEIENPSLLKLVALYCLWLTKYTDLVIQINSDNVEIHTSNKLRNLSTMQSRVLEEVSNGIEITHTNGFVLIKY
jgi:hypothetical protein